MEWMLSSGEEDTEGSYMERPSLFHHGREQGQLQSGVGSEDRPGRGAWRAAWSSRVSRVRPSGCLCRAGGPGPPPAQHFPSRNRGKVGFPERQGMGEGQEDNVKTSQTGRWSAQGLWSHTPWVQMPALPPPRLVSWAWPLPAAVSSAVKGGGFLPAS